MIVAMMAWRFATKRQTICTRFKTQQLTRCWRQWLSTFRTEFRLQTVIVFVVEKLPPPTAFLSTVHGSLCCCGCGWCWCAATSPRSGKEHWAKGGEQEESVPGSGSGSRRGSIAKFEWTVEKIHNKHLRLQFIFKVLRWGPEWRPFE